MHSNVSTRKASKGSVAVGTNEGRLRIQLPRTLYGGKQKYLSLGLKDTPENRLKAESIAARIQADLDHPDGLFDLTLEKYKPKTHLTVIESVKPRIEPTLNELWGKYLEYKKAQLKESTFDYLERLLGSYINRCPIQDLSQSLEIRAYLLKTTTSSMTKRILTHLSASCKWGQKHKLIKDNPFDGMANELPKHNWEDNSLPNAFSEEEKQRIIEAFENHNGNWNGRGYTGCAYSYYAPFIKFLFLTGCRPSEAIGLQWQQIKDDCSQITFEGSIVRIGSNSKPVRMRGSKNNKSRKFNCNQQLQELLLSIKPADYDPESLVFPSPKGKVINYSNFSKKAWDRIVDPIVGRETTPYCCRDTFISEQIAKGVSSAIVAKWCDNSVDVIEKKYLDTKMLEHLKPL